MLGLELRSAFLLLGRDGVDTFADVAEGVSGVVLSTKMHKLRKLLPQTQDLFSKTLCQHLLQG